eukprot:CAMPEP_0176006536 /NCGR_PEP_ID=MMETSP0120_2-20121206/2771_1 /TAXON_ID=160619 /ORGANISM="Kryptoperidinium foliaceum, Strain CCMP 1326" /LENGTH=104 /DNA_ID=CAMNT_0017339275 /DNA_START=104 /DNA_END=417 /DNA_ORIENTATION=-
MEIEKERRDAERSCATDADDHATSKADFPIGKMCGNLIAASASSALSGAFSLRFRQTPSRHESTHEEARQRASAHSNLATNNNSMAMKATVSATTCGDIAAEEV